jgi:hypothetical protein
MALEVGTECDGKSVTAVRGIRLKQKAADLVTQSLIDALL